MYVDAKNESEYHIIYFKLINELMDLAPNTEILALIMEISQKILEGEHYIALKVCKKLLNYELELMADVTG